MSILSFGLLMNMIRYVAVPYDRKSTAPITLSQASVWCKNYLEKSGFWSTGYDINDHLRQSNAFRCVGNQTTLSDLPFPVRSVRIADISAKCGLNFLWESFHSNEWMNLSFFLFFFVGVVRGVYYLSPQFFTLLHLVCVYSSISNHMCQEPKSP